MLPLQKTHKTSSSVVGFMNSSIFFLLLLHLQTITPFSSFYCKYSLYPMVLLVLHVCFLNYQVSVKALQPLICVFTLYHSIIDPSIAPLLGQRIAIRTQFSFSSPFTILILLLIYFISFFNVYCSYTRRKSIYLPFLLYPITSFAACLFICKNSNVFVFSSISFLLISALFFISCRFLFGTILYEMYLDHHMYAITLQSLIDVFSCTIQFQHFCLG